MFEVRFNTEEEGIKAIGWEPKAGDGVQCGEREARRRFDYLLAKGRAGKKVDGVIPYLVEVVDEDGTLMLGVTTAEDDEPTGVWARAKAA